MITPKEKAKELVDKFINNSSDYMPSGEMDRVNYNAKQCALIAVDEILDSAPSYEYWKVYDDETPSAITFWNEVKQEINNL